MLGIGWVVAMVVLAVVGMIFVVATKAPKTVIAATAIVGGGLSMLLLILSMVVTVEAGHAGVATYFGKVEKESKLAGMHFANPLLDWKYYDCRQKTHKEAMGVPSKDQLLTKIDVSVQYKIQASMTPTILSETGTIADVIEIHMKPTLRSVLREQGKSVEKAEDFFLDTTQQRIQAALADALLKKLTPKGVMIQEVLLRDITLPDTIRKGVEAKKKRDQEAEKEKATLRMFETQQQQKVKTAEAELDAAKLEAEGVKVKADARAYEIKQLNEAIKDNPAYIKLEALKSLQSISKDPNSKIYFLNGDSPSPLPLMHLGDKK